MKKTFLSIIALLLGMSANAQQGFLLSIHNEVNDAQLTPDSSPEDVTDYIIKGSGNNIMLIPGSSLAALSKKTDAFGNIHVGYGMVYDGKMSIYQAFLHFRPDGTPYYINGKLPLLDMDAPAEGPESAKGRTQITAERASLIAIGNTAGEVAKTIVTYKNKPRVAYKVTEPGALQEVYVDVYTGEVLHTISHILSFAPWSDVHGTNVNVLANTMYVGMQPIDAMQTADGYILRDPVRNIITLNASDKFKDYAEEFPDEISQIIMLSAAAEEFVYDEPQLQNAEYATVVRSLLLRYTPKEGEEGAPASTTIHAYYADADKNPIGDILNIDNVKWTEQAAGVYECELVFPEPVSVNLLHDNHIVEFTIDGKVYTRTNVLTVSECTLRDVKDADGTPIGMKFNFDVAANPMQPALDIHWSIQKTYDMYDTYFGIKGSDGEGCQLINLVNPSNNIPLFAGSGYPENASAVNFPLVDAYNNKTFYMFYGMGSVEGNMKPLVELPIIAHEFTHTITAGCGNSLITLEEPGALNEATADCMAMVAEDFAFGQPSWKFGANTSLFSGNIRDLKDPWYSGNANGSISEKNAQPKYYGGRYWHDYIADPKKDNGGVHINNGVFNYMFYLLCEGAQSITNEVGETHTIEAIGMDTMKDILLHSMLYYNCTICDYAEIADNLMIAAADLAPKHEGKTEKLQEQMAIAYQHVGMTTTITPTGIATVAIDAKSPYAGTYNLYGAPVDSSYKGVVIKNGKKITQNK